MSSFPMLHRLDAEVAERRAAANEIIDAATAERRDLTRRRFGRWA